MTKKMFAVDIAVCVGSSLWPLFFMSFVLIWEENPTWFTSCVPFIHLIQACFLFIIHSNLMFVSSVFTQHKVGKYFFINRLPIVLESIPRTVCLKSYQAGGPNKPPPRAVPGQARVRVERGGGLKIYLFFFKKGTEREMR